MKNSNDTIGTGTLDILACSAVSQATAPPRIVPRKALNTRTEPTQETRSKTFYFRPSNARNYSPICNISCRKMTTPKTCN